MAIDSVVGRVRAVATRNAVAGVGDAFSYKM
jgi:hypothetical protein